MRPEEVLLDLAAFADDEDEVALGPDGHFMILRQGRELSGQILEEGDDIFVQVGEDLLTYRQFLTVNLGRLDVLANRLLARAPGVPHFVEGPARLLRPASDVEYATSAMHALDNELKQGSPFITRIVFVTADAGLGKTALLRELQARTASKFLAGQSRYLLWHLDLQGRQLLRLNEALMGDLGDLRMFGLWMPGLVRLMRSRALVVAIDGFDELSAEQGSNTSLGALASITAQLDGKGTIVAAARRTFFDADDYLRRAKMVQRSTTSPCEFVEMGLIPWGRRESVDLLDKYALETGGSTRFDSPVGEPEDPVGLYERILEALGGVEDHPVLTRPFLLSRTAKAVVELGLSVDEFLRPGQDQFESIAALVDAFIQREVGEKWKDRVSGEPFLTVEQHSELLANVAEEMYQSATDRLPVPVIDTIASMLFDTWGIPQDSRQQVINMVRMHVLLIRPPESTEDMRSFDHPEFRDYFIAVALAGRLLEVALGHDRSGLARFLAVSQLSDSTARYVVGMLMLDEAKTIELLKALQSIVVTELRPTYLQLNVGTLLPFVLSMRHTATWTFDAPAISSSISWEGSNLAHTILHRVAFVNVSLDNVTWDDVQLRDCQLGDLQIGSHSQFSRVTLHGCSVDSVRVGGQDSMREFSPDRIRAALESVGIFRVEDSEPRLTDFEDHLESVSAARALFSMFKRSTVVRETQIKLKLKGSSDSLIGEIVEAAVANSIIESRTWRGAGQDRIWQITARLDDVLRAESGAGLPNLVKFWKDIRHI
ncbi:hypothetical protein [Propioniciclava tarda]|uniref:NACHT domain-containing protein n=1 Tax=Propioniciclava tarda TaxID=433330 RepID=A0A4Q9KM98_PROTD|nr:hypothetical protein [Propioniciclava tarda]TBT95080.1 hypothetical protein ET996_07395 [Propioniciclava tarda]SMO55604.1 hypothetical protein SAMN06266982_10687 [Propioniciclava tarda]